MSRAPVLVWNVSNPLFPCFFRDSGMACRRGLLKFGLAFGLLLAANGATAQDELVDRGRTVYVDWCAICHAPGEGATRILEERYQGALPAVVDERTNLTAELITARVRTWVAPQMPPFRQSEVSDADLEAVIAYLKRNDE